MLLAGGLCLVAGGLTPVPSWSWPSFPQRGFGVEPFFAADPNGGEWLERSRPVRVDIETVGVHAPLVKTGVTRGGEFEVPSLYRPHEASWFERGATPGEFGATVLLGHVDTEVSGPAVFFRLKELGGGDLVEVTREDGVVVVYEVVEVRSHAKDDLPYEAIFGIGRTPVLRLITCGGRFDRRTGDYEDNVVVYAEYVEHRKATKADEARKLNGRDHFRKRLAPKTT
jgi:hypothetical protein